MKRMCASIVLVAGLALGLTSPQQAPAQTGGGSGCQGDINNDGQVNVNDLLIVLSNWGECPSPCPADLNGDGIVNVNDLLLVITNFGPCNGPACVSPADCDDGNPCTFDLCIQGVCHNIPIPNCR